MESAAPARIDTGAALPVYQQLDAVWDIARITAR